MFEIITNNLFLILGGVAFLGIVFALWTYVLKPMRTKKDNAALNEKIDVMMDGMNKEAQVVYLFFLPGCPTCKMIKPIWEKLKKAFNSNNKITFKEVDCSITKYQKICQDFGIKHVPTIIKFPKRLDEEKSFIEASKARKDFDSSPTFEKLVDFVKN